MSENTESDSKEPKIENEEENLTEDHKKLIAKVKSQVPKSLSIISVKSISNSEFQSSNGHLKRNHETPIEHPKELKKFIFGKLHSEMTVEVQNNETSQKLTPKDFMRGDKHRFSREPGEIFLPNWQHGDEHVSTTSSPMISTYSGINEDEVEVNIDLDEENP